MRAFLRLVAPCVAAAALTVALVTPVGAYGGGASHDMWQIGLSFNCNNTDFCGAQLGGAWGWVEFDRSADGTVTWGDAEIAFCSHTVGGGAPGSAGAGHARYEVESWTIAPGSAGPETFFANGELTQFFRGEKVTTDFTDLDTGIPAVPGHYSTADVLGFTAPGVAVVIQVAFRPAK
jgi:hypothetical protein